MKSISISGSSRTEVGKKATNALRNAGLVPCNLYGVEKEAKAFSVPTEGLRKLVYTPDIHIVELTIDGKTVKAIMKDIQFHPVKDTILHVDFYQVTEDKPIVMAVPVKLEGLAEGVRAGGKLVQVQRYLKVKALYTAIPEILTVDVTALQLGKSIKVGELSYEGLAAGVRAGGKLVQVQRDLKVKALYTAIPEILTVDVTALGLGKSIKVGELSYEGLELVSAKESLVCSVKTTRASAAAAAAARK